MAKRAIKCKVYVRTGGSFSTPTWTEAATVGDAVANVQWDQGDASSRDTPVKQFDITQLNLDVSGKIRIPTGTNTAYDTLDDAFVAGSEVDVMILNGPSTETGVKGYRFEGKVFNWSEDQAMANVLYKDFLIAPTPTDNDPQFVEVVSGAPVYAAIP